MDLSYIREDVVAFPQCIVSNEIFRTGRHVVMKDTIVIKSRPNLSGILRNFVTKDPQ